LREPPEAYNADFHPQISLLSQENALIWKIFDEELIG
jgi:hypothetical protein